MTLQDRTLKCLTFRTEQNIISQIQSQSCSIHLSSRRRSPVVISRYDDYTAPPPCQIYGGVARRHVLSTAGDVRNLREYNNALSVLIELKCDHIKILMIGN